MKIDPPDIHYNYFGSCTVITFKSLMKISWTSLKISIAGAKLSHLVQKDKIWDHGSMAEQARIIFYLVQKAKYNGNIESLKKQCTIPCFEKLKEQMEELEMHDKVWQKETPMITELAVIEVKPGKNNNPDMFIALINGYSKEERHEYDVQKNRFSEHWSFIRQGDWWLLDKIKIF